MLPKASTSRTSTFGSSDVMNNIWLHGLRTRTRASWQRQRLSWNFPFVFVQNLDSPPQRGRAPRTRDHPWGAKKGRRRAKDFSDCEIHSPGQAGFLVRVVPSKVVPKTRQILADSKNQSYSSRPPLAPSAKSLVGCAFACVCVLDIYLRSVEECSHLPLREGRHPNSQRQPRKVFWDTRRVADLPAKTNKVLGARLAGRRVTCPQVLKYKTQQRIPHQTPPNSFCFRLCFRRRNQQENQGEETRPSDLSEERPSCTPGFFEAHFQCS